MERTPNRKIPILILLAMLLIGALIVFFSMNDKQKKVFLNAFKSDPLGIKSQIENSTETEEVEVVRDINEVFQYANDQMLNSDYVTCKVYKNKILYKNNVESWAINKETGIYTCKDNNQKDIYVDLYNNIYYYINNGKWYKKSNELVVNTDMSIYTIPSSATQIEDRKIDGANCYVFYDNEKYYYIKKSSETIGYIEENRDGATYYYQFSSAKLEMDERIVSNAVEQ